MIHNSKKDSIAEIGDKGVFVLTLRSLLRLVAPHVNCRSVIEPRGSFDSSVNEAVLAFQRFAGLPQTGVVDYNTWERLYEVAQAFESGYFYEYPGYELKLGFTGKDVKRLKYMLLKLKRTVPSIRISSLSEIFDTETELSMIRAQRAYGLIPDGKAGRQSWEKLVSLMAD